MTDLLEWPLDWGRHLVDVVFTEPLIALIVGVAIGAAIGYAFAATASMR